MYCKSIFKKTAGVQHIQFISGIIVSILGSVRVLIPLKKKIRQILDIIKINIALYDFV